MRVDDKQQLNDYARLAFGFKCKLCGSEDVVIDVKARETNGTTVFNGHLAIGCNACKKNDFFWDL